MQILFLELEEIYRVFAESKSTEIHRGYFSAYLLGKFPLHEKSFAYSL